MRILIVSHKKGNNLTQGLQGFQVFRYTGSPLRCDRPVLLSFKPLNPNGDKKNYHLSSLSLQILARPPVGAHVLMQIPFDNQPSCTLTEEAG